MEENLTPGNVGTGTETVAATESTQGTAEVETGTTQETPVTENKPEKLYTKSQVNEMMKKRVDRSHNAFFTRYGVKDLKGLDELLGKSQYYDETKAANEELTNKYSDLETKHKDLSKRYAYKVGNIDEKKIADIETYFKGKGIDIDEATLMEELKTHPDWVNKVSTIKQLGAEVQVQDEKDARAEASRIFGVSLR